MKYKSQRLLLIVIALLLSTTVAFTQTRKASKAIKKQEKMERLQEKSYQKARKKTIKHRHDIQTKETQERMEGVDKKAKAYNRQNDEPWLKHLFKRKKPKK